MLTLFVTGLMLAAPPEVAPLRYHVSTTRTDKLEPTPILAYTKDGTLKLTTMQELKPEEFLGLQRADLPRPAYPQLPGILMANGDYVVGEVIVGDAKSLTLQSRLGTNDSTLGITIPLTAIIGIWCTEPPNRDLDRIRWNLDARKGDRLILRNKDSIRGTLISVDGKGIKFKPQGETTTKQFELSAVAATHLDPALARMKLPASYHKLVTRNGTRISLVELNLRGPYIAGKTVFGSNVTLPLDELVAWDVVQNKAVSLADMKPVELVETPFNTLVWKMKVNRTVEDRPLQLKTARGIENYDVGLGMHSATRVTYELPVTAERFEALVGLDAATGQKGCVDIRIFVDGQERDVPQLKGVKFGPAVEVRFPLGNARKLTLAVDFGSGGDIQDVVNWANPRVIVK